MGRLFVAASIAWVVFLAGAFGRVSHLFTLGDRWAVVIFNTLLRVGECTVAVVLMLLIDYKAACLRNPMRALHGAGLSADSSHTNSAIKTGEHVISFKITNKHTPATTKTEPTRS